LETALEAIGKWATRWISEEDLARTAGSSLKAAEPARGRSAASGAKQTRRAKAAKRR
jgi:hypothetical protein